MSNPRSVRSHISDRHVTVMQWEGEQIKLPTAGPTSLRTNKRIRSSGSEGSWSPGRSSRDQHHGEPVPERMPFAKVPSPA
jgi:hypothetical protein